MFHLKSRNTLFLLLIVIFGSALRLYALNWGSPFYFHPDERNIAGSISRMYWEKTLNPHFFAYGSFWSYIALPVVALAKARFNTDPFIAAILILRVFSALQGVGLIILSYFIGKHFLRRSLLPFTSYLLPFLTATSPGLIQASHFGTFEESLAFLYALIFYLSLKFLETKKFAIWLLICVVFGISISIRVTSVILLPIIAGVLFCVFCQGGFSTRPWGGSGDPPLRKILSWLLYPFILILIPIIIFFISNPYSFSLQPFSHLTIEPFSIFSHEFLSTMKYESEVALGTMQVFYTGQFNQTTPIIYQFFRVLPFILNPVIWILFILSLTIPVIIPLISLISCVFKKIPVRIKMPNITLILTLLFFAATFLSGATMFVKWTRYVIPSLPFIYIIIFFFLLKTFKFPLIPLIALFSLVFSIFFTSIYSFDTRIAAANWAHKNLKPDVKILSEVYDMGIVPFNEVFPYQNITLFNFYEMDDVFNDAGNLAELKNLINQFNVIVLPSRRVADTRLRLPSLYPNGNWFYKNLFAGNLGFRLVKTFSHPYDNILAPLSPDESFTVFDHPTVMIFVKQ